LTSGTCGRRTIGSLFVASVLLLAVAALAFSLSQVPIVSSDAHVDQFRTTLTDRLTFTRFSRTLSWTRTLPTLPFPGRSCAVEGLSTDKLEYHLGDTVTITLCYPVPEQCPLPVLQYDVYGLYEGSEIDHIDSFGGYIGCGAFRTYEYRPTMKGLYTIVLDQSPPGDVISFTDFQVGDPSSPVGGEVVNVSAFQLLLPCIALSSIAASTALAARYLPHKKAKD